MMLIKQLIIFIVMGVMINNEMYIKKGNQLLENYNNSFRRTWYKLEKGIMIKHSLSNLHNCHNKQQQRQCYITKCQTGMTCELFLCHQILLNTVCYRPKQSLLKNQGKFCEQLPNGKVFIRCRYSCSRYGCHQACPMCRFK